MWARVVSPPFLIKTLRPNKNSILGPQSESGWSTGAAWRRNETRIIFCFVRRQHSLGWAGLGWAGLGWESSVLTYCCHHHLTPTFLSTCPLQTSIPLRNGVTAVIMIIEVHHVRLVDTFMVTAERLSYFQFLFSIIILCL